MAVREIVIHYLDLVGLELGQNEREVVKQNLNGNVLNPAAPKIVNRTINAAESTASSAMEIKALSFPEINVIQRQQVKPRPRKLCHGIIIGIWNPAWQTIGATVVDAWNRGSICFLTVQNSLAKYPKRLFALAGHDMVDVGTR